MTGPRTHVLSALLTLPVALAAQETTRDRIAAAVDEGQDAWAAMTMEISRTMPVADLVAAFEEPSRLLERRYWDALAQFLHPRSRELATWWLENAEGRVKTRRLFAALALPWSKMHADGDDDLRAEIEDLTAYGPGPVTDALANAWSRDAKHQAAARRLMQRDARIWETRTDERLAAHLTTDAAEAPFDARSVSPFAIARHLDDERPHVRAAASLLLHNTLGAQTPIHVFAALRDHPGAWYRSMSAHRHLDARDVDEALDRLDDDALELLQRGTWSDLPAAARRRAADRLFRAAQGVPAPAPARVPGGPKTPGPTALKDPNDLRTIAMLTGALRADAEACRWVLALAVNADRAWLRARCLRALHSELAASEKMLLFAPDYVTPLPAGLAPLALDLLDAERAPNALAAGAVLDRATRGDAVDPDLKAEVVRRALALLARPATRLSFSRRPMGFCGTGGPPLGPPSDAASYVVFAAARLGDARLVAPLLARLPAAVGDDPPFVRTCLAALVDELTPAQAAEVFATLAPELGVWTNFSAGDQVTRALASALVRRAPAETFDELAKVARARPMDDVWELLYSLRHVLPREKLRAMLAERPLGAQRRCGVFVAFPDLLAQAAKLDPSARRRAYDAVVYALATEPRLTAAEAAALPTDLLLQALRPIRHAAPLGAIEVAVTASIEGLPFVELIERAELGDAPLLALRRLAEHENPALRVAVAHRLAAFGDAERRLATELVEQALTSSDRRLVAQALTTAIRADLEPAGWAAATERTDPTTAMLARVHFGGEVPTVGYILVHHHRLSGRPLELATLRTARPDLWLLQDALTRGDAATQLTVLEYAAEVAEWPEQFEKHVLQRTASTDPALRRAAYAALAARDRATWPSAWLAFEAALDPDAAVRATAPPDTR